MSKKAKNNNKNLSDLELEFIANAALAFDNMIADEQADLSHVAEIARFLVGKAPYF